MPLRKRIFLSCNSNSCAAEQFHSDANLEKVHHGSPNNSKNWQWTTEGDVSARWLLFAPHGPEWPNNFPQSVGSILIYCYRCRNMGFVIRQLLLHRGLLAKVPLYRIPLTVNHRRLYLLGVLSTELNKLIGTKLFFKMNYASVSGSIVAAFVFDAMLVNLACQSTLSSDILTENPK